MNRDRFQKTFLLVLVIGISLAFIAMIRGFLTAIFLSAIFSGLLYPVFKRIRRLFRGRKKLAALSTVVLFILLVVAPMLTFLGLVAKEAFRVSESVMPWVQDQLARENLLDRAFERLPFSERIDPYREQILTRAGQIVGRLGEFSFQRLSATTKGTAQFLFNFFIVIYSMFFFLLEGRRILERVLYYMPLENKDESRMLEKFVSVSRATLKGTLFIGLVQGTLGGIAFVLVGIDAAILWATVMAVLSIIPGVGAALVWVPAVLYLIVVGAMGKAVFLGLFCALIVGTADNALRPRLVGRDAKMHDLLILFGSIGGISLFGFAGVLIGPLIAALFVTIWDIYGVVFKDALPKVGKV